MDQANGINYFIVGNWGPGVETQVNDRASIRTQISCAFAEWKLCVWYCVLCGISIFENLYSMYNSYGSFF